MRTKTKQKAIDWFNNLGKTKREELSLEYFGVVDLLMDDDILMMYLEEVPHFTLEEHRLNIMYCLSLFAAQRELVYTSEEMKIVNEWGDIWCNENLK